MGKLSKSLVVASVSAAALLVAGTGIASAGEVTGNGKPVTIHAKSLCAFSGLEDWASTEEQPEGGILVSPGTVQNWGHTKKAFGATGGANSVQTPFGEEGCNAHLYPAK
jgi:hypothetical protein